MGGFGLNLAELAVGPPLDVAIIGGGINGCGIARELSLRGMRIALFEANDFGFGTTWRSTKLIHGGLRYLEHGDVRLVFESLRERAWLLRTRPHLVAQQRFILPTLPWTRRPAWQIRTGLGMYDALAMRGGLPRHRAFSRETLARLAPVLPAEMTGGFSFYDARARSPERLALELVLEAESTGAAVFNHARVERLFCQSGTITAIKVERNRETFDVPCRAVINAAGPWVDAVNATADSKAPELLGVTRGSHVVIETDYPLGRDAVLSMAKEDGRVFFVVPQDGLVLIGTTDLRYEGDPGAIRPTRRDVDYLVREARTLLPGLSIRREQVRYAYAGLRPLQRVNGGAEAGISRRHELIDHGKRGGAAGTYSVIGGKLSTFRPLATEVASKLNANRRPPEPLPIPPADLPWLHMLKTSGLPPEMRRHLRLYGPSLPNVLAFGTDEICQHSRAVSGEITHSVKSEHATTLSDVLLRRTGIGWSSCRGMCCKDRVARLMSPLLGWDEAEQARQLRAFEADAAYHIPKLDELAEES
jgi:glycerol-3-phosphate dehydrogenase